MDVQLGAMNLGALGISDVDVASDGFSASLAIIHLDDALNYVNKQRATLGAQMARIESSISATQAGVEASSAARSRVIDADYAAETANLTRATILHQAGIAIAAQANSMPSRVLSLLGA